MFVLCNHNTSGIAIYKPSFALFGLPGSEFIARVVLSNTNKALQSASKHFIKFPDNPYALSKLNDLSIEQSRHSLGRQRNM